MKDDKLEVGDVVYATYRGGAIERRHVIERLTKTLAISGSSKFRINIGSSGNVQLLGRNKWSTTYYYIATPERDEKYFRLKSAEQIKSLDFTTMPIEKIKEILEIIKTNKQ